jgi:hypothetical protein
MTTTTPEDAELELDPAPPVHPSRRSKILVGILCAVVIAAGLSSTVLQIANAAAIRRQDRSDDLAGCRSVYSVEMVTGPTLAALKAQTLGNKAGALAAVNRADPEGFQDLVRFSRTHPDEFLRQCHKANP